MEIQLAAMAAPEDGSVDDEVRSARAQENLRHIADGYLLPSCGCRWTRWSVLVRFRVLKVPHIWLYDAVF